VIPLKEAPTTFKRSPKLHPVPRLEQRHDRLVQLAVLDNSDELFQGLLGVPWAGLKAIRSCGGSSMLLHKRPIRGGREGFVPVGAPWAELDKPCGVRSSFTDSCRRVRAVNATDGRAQIHDAERATNHQTLAWVSCQGPQKQTPAG
jgi:hypothetical protein